MSYQQNGGNNFNNRLADYVEVNVRIGKFYEKYPQGSIQTEILKWEDSVVVMKAYAYRTPDDTRPATGHAYEKEGSSQVNRTSALENCETSAVGRALALLGFEIKKSVASKEEVENAIHQQEQPEATKQTSSQTRQNTAQSGSSATPKQLQFLHKKAKDKGFDGQTYAKWIHAKVGKTDDQLTKAEASDLIAALDEVNADEPFDFASA